MVGSNLKEMSAFKPGLANVQENNKHAAQRTIKSKLRGRYTLPKLPYTRMSSAELSRLMVLNSDELKT